MKNVAIEKSTEKSENAVVERYAPDATIRQ